MPINAEYPPDIIFLSVTAIYTLSAVNTLPPPVTLTESTGNAGSAPAPLTVVHGMSRKPFSNVISGLPLSSAASSGMSLCAMELSIITTGFPEKLSQRLLPVSSKALQVTDFSPFFVSII